MPGRELALELAAKTLKRSGMTPNPVLTIVNWPNVNPRKKPRYARIVSAGVGRLPINNASVLRKENLDELGADGERERVSRLQRSIEEAQSEREQLLSDTMRKLAVQEKVQQLQLGRCERNGGGFAFDQIPPGEHAVAALEVVIGKNAQHKVRIHLVKKDGQDGAARLDTKAYSTPRCFEAAVQKARERLRPLLCTAAATDGGNEFFMNLVADPIGTFCAPHELIVSVDGTQVHVLGDAQGGASSSTSGSVESPSSANNRSPRDGLPVLPYVHETDRHSFAFLDQSMQASGLKDGSVLSVLAAAEEPVAYNNAKVWPLRVVLNGEERLVFGRGKVISRKHEMMKNCCLKVTKVLKGDVKVDVVQEGQWWKLLPAYNDLPELYKGMHPAPDCVDIEAYAHVPRVRRGDGENVVVQMTDGKVYRFRCPQQVNNIATSTLTLEKGCRFDLEAWKTVRR